MKYLLIILIFVFVACETQSENPQFTAQEFLELSQQKHDPNKSWESIELSLHIQEPRPQTPFRYSILFLDNATGEFRLTREVEEGRVDRIITPRGDAKILLNGEIEISKEIREKYGLETERNHGFKSFYQTMYGLPMSLNNGIVETLERDSDDVFEEKETYVIRVTLKEPIISKNWVLYISKQNYSLTGLKFDHPETSDRQDEFIHFGGEFMLDEITIPRFRHWYHKDSEDYLGSDIIVKNIPQN